MLRHVIRAAAAGAVMSAWALGAQAAPVGGLATGLKANADQGNGLQQAAYRCWYRHGIRHCRWFPTYYGYDDYYDDGPYYGYGPGIGLYFGGGGGGGHFHGGHFGGGHFGGHHH